MDDNGVPLAGIRKAMAGAMARSWNEIPHFAESVEIDAEPVLSCLEASRTAAPDNAPRVTINDLLVHAAAQALAGDERLNVLFDGKRLHTCTGANIAVAVATDHGLMTPVIHGADELDLYGLASVIREKATRARSWSLAPDEFEGGVLTVSNLGAHNVDSGFPVINQRQTALLFMGSIKKRPWVDGDAVVARNTAYLTLACDHRIIDGVSAAAFLERIVAHFTRLGADTA